MIIDDDDDDDDEDEDEDEEIPRRFHGIAFKAVLVFQATWATGTRAILTGGLLERLESKDSVLVNLEYSNSM